MPKPAFRWIGNHPKCDVAAFGQRTDFTITVGMPKATRKYTAEMLEEHGWVGVYTQDPPHHTRRYKHPFRLGAPWRKFAAVVAWVFRPVFAFGRKTREKGTRP